MGIEDWVLVPRAKVDVLGSSIHFSSLYSSSLLSNRDSTARSVDYVFATDTLIIRLKDLAHSSILPAGARPWASLDRAFKLKVASGSVALEVAAELNKLPEVEFAEPDWCFTGRGGAIPQDPLFALSWGLHNVGQSGGLFDMDVNAPEAWDITHGKPALKILVIDTGVDFNHPDLLMAGGVDVTGEGVAGEAVNSCDNHGTPVAGVIGATMNNSLGSTGIAPACSLYSARVFISEANCSGSWVTQASWTVDALAWAESQGIQVTTNSNVYGFGALSISTKYEETAQGMLHFGIAGNNGVATIAYPANLDSVQAVGSIDADGTRSGFSNYGPELRYSAPGNEIFLLDRSGPLGWSLTDFTTDSGTSHASPLVAGIAALLWSQDLTQSPQDILDLLDFSARDLGPPGIDPEYGVGLVDARAALELGLPIFIRGDLTQDGILDISDSVQLLAALFLASPNSCNLAGDVNNDNALEISDAVYLLSYLFLAGSPLPAAPVLACGKDLDGSGDLDCEGHSACL